MLYGYFYRALMTFAHRYNWHYAPPWYPEGDTLLWCQWCGFRQIVKRRDYKPIISNVPQQQQSKGAARE